VLFSEAIHERCAPNLITCVDFRTAIKQRVHLSLELAHHEGRIFDTARRSATEIRVSAVSQQEAHRIRAIASTLFT
jgi:hypothetical protein